MRSKNNPENEKILNEILASDISDEKPETTKHTTKELLDWIDSRNSSLKVHIERISLDECAPWFFDEERGCVRNTDNTFFQIYGLRQYAKEELITEQPVIVQNEIGFLGILTCKIEGTWHYLMQAKIEPGNVNVVQISPTLQATKSNFTGAHGGRIPAYLEYFLEADPDKLIVDQIQSEQSSRFLKKRNRNVIVSVDSPLPETDSHKWMSLRQIKELMHYDNLVNMDTRTVLSCIPYVLMKQDADVPFLNKSYFYKTAWTMNRRTIAGIYHEINDLKMLSEYRTELVSIDELTSWVRKPDEIEAVFEHPYKVIYCDINIEGREVTHWRQRFWDFCAVMRMGYLSSWLRSDPNRGVLMLRR